MGNAKFCPKCGAPAWTLPPQYVAQQIQSSQPLQDVGQYNQYSPQYSPVINKIPLYKKWWFWAIISLVVVSFVIAVVSGGTASDSGKTTVSVEPPNSLPATSESTPSATTDSEIPGTQSQDPSSNQYSPSALSPPASAKIMNVDYISMWENYSDEKYLDKWVKITGKLRAKKNFIGLYIMDGLGGGFFDYISISPVDNNAFDGFKAGDYATIIGKVKGKFGVLTIENATIKKATKKEIASIAKYKKEREAKAKSEEQKYINSAKTISYSSLIREPDKYKGEILKVNVRIVQLMSGGILSQAGYRGYSGNNEWFIKYDLPKGAPRIIEGDTVTFYGKYAGLVKVKRAITSTTEYVPELDVEYYR